MDVVLLCLAILAVAAYVARPLYGPTAERSQTRAPAAPAPLRTALDDLEVDRASGLIDEATYTRERAALEATERAND